MTLVIAFLPAVPFSVVVSILAEEQRMRIPPVICQEDLETVVSETTGHDSADIVGK